MFEGYPDYEKIKAELDPMIARLAKAEGRTTPEYQRFKKKAHEWNEKFDKAARTAGTVESIQKLQIPLLQRKSSENRRLLAVINLYRYLGLVESLGPLLWI